MLIILILLTIISLSMWGWIGYSSMEYMFSLEEKAPTLDKPLTLKQKMYSRIAGTLLGLFCYVLMHGHYSKAYKGK